MTIFCVGTYAKTAAIAAASAAETRAAKRGAKCALREPGGDDFFTRVVFGSYGRKYSATHTLLNLLGRLAAGSGRIAKGRGSLPRCGD